MNCKNILFFTYLFLLSPQFLRAETKTLHVNSSAKPKGNGTATSPFTNIESALSYASAIKFNAKSGNILEIVLYKGTYFVTNTLRIPSIPGVQIIISALKGQFVAISGGIVLENEWLKPFYPANSTKKNVYYYAYDLKKAGIRDFGTLRSYGFRRPYYPAPLELFINQKPFHIAKYPNEGEPWLEMGKVTDPGSNPAYLDFSNRGGVFETQTNKLAAWAKEKNGWIGGYFAFAWADDALKIKNIDVRAETIATSSPAMFGLASGHAWSRYYVFNMLSELDQPFEYYVDQQEGTLYFCSAEKIIDQEVSVSLLETPLLSIVNCQNVTIKGITFECTRGMGVYLEGSNNCVIKNCSFRNIGMVGAVFGKGIEPFAEYKEKGTGKPVSEALGSWHEHLYNNPTFDRNAGTQNGIDSCHFYNIGMGAVSLSGGNRVTLTNGGNYVMNSKMHDFNRLGKTYRTGVNIDGCGNIIKNNEIFQAEHAAIYIHGNNHLIEGNNIHHCCTNSEDMGAIYMGRDPSEAGTIIRGNYFHDIMPAKPGYRVAAIFFDDGASYATIENNVFYNCGDEVFGACYSNSGQFLRYSSNIFAYCSKGIGYAVWDKKRWNDYYDIDIWQERLFKFVNIKAEPYKTKYPGLGEKLRDQNNLPIVRYSIFVNCKKMYDKSIQPADNYATQDGKAFKQSSTKIELALDQSLSWFSKINAPKWATQTLQCSKGAGNPNEY